MDEAELVEVGDDPVRRLNGDDELHEAHLFRSHVIYQREPIEDFHPSARRLESERGSRSQGHFSQIQGQTGAGTILKAFSHKLGFKQSLQA